MDGDDKKAEARGASRSRAAGFERQQGCRSPGLRRLGRSWRGGGVEGPLCGPEARAPSDRRFRGRTRLSLLSASR